jgi:hypothetical protein
MSNSDGTEEMPAAGELVWHYTDFKGLQGILDGEIWASSVAYLNDTEESRHAVKIAAAVLEEERETLSCFKDVDAPPATGAFDPLVKFFREIDGKNTFVSSFSSKSDDLSQWRAYGGAGPSFAIGFDPRRLAIRAHAVHFDFVRVLYSRAQIESAIRSAVQKYFASFKSSSEARNPDLYRDISFGLSVIGALFPLAARCKHESFKDEDEWRLVHQQSRPARRPALFTYFRQKGSLVVPYVKISLHEPSAVDPTTAPGLTKQVDSPVAAITIGPSPHPEELRYAVGDMALRKGLIIYPEISSVPFRNW